MRRHIRYIVLAVTAVAVFPALAVLALRHLGPAAAITLSLYAGMILGGGLVATVANDFLDTLESARAVDSHPDKEAGR